MYKISSEILGEIDYSPLDVMVKNKYPKSSFDSNEMLNSVFVEDTAYMAILDKKPRSRIWLFLFQILNNEWILSVSKETKRDKEIYRVRRFVPPIDELDKATVPYRLIKDFLNEL